jgi:ligand-binding sensor domain-containing protein
VDAPDIIPPTPFSYERPRIYSVTLPENKTYYWRVRNNYLNADSNLIGSEWKNSRFTTGEGLTNIWNYYNNSNSGIKENIITELAIGNNNEIWASLYQQGIAQFDGNTWNFYNSKSTNGIMVNDAGGLYVDRVNNIVWTGGVLQNHPSIFRFENNSWTVYDYSNSGLPSTGELWPTATIRDANGIMWFATGRGLFKFDGKNWTTYNSANSPLPSDYLESLTSEPNGTIWIGTTDAGLAKFDGSNWTIYNTLNSSLPGNRIFDILIDSSNSILAACYDGIARFNNSQWEIYNISSPGVQLSYFTRLTKDKQGNIWIGGGGGIQKFNGTFGENYLWYNSQNPVGHLAALDISDNGKIWIGGDGEGLVSYDPGTINTENKTIQVADYSYSISPNPSHDQFSLIINSEQSKSFKLKLINSVGQLVEERSVKSSGLVLTEHFNVSDLNRGIYFLIISSEKNQSVEKIIVQ